MLVLWQKANIEIFLRHLFVSNYFIFHVILGGEKLALNHSPQSATVIVSF